jgi:hypothetical protein
MSFERAKKLVKRVVAYPEGQPPVISSREWVADNLAKDPKDFVCSFIDHYPCCPYLFYSLKIGYPLFLPTLPYPWMDRSLQ